MLCYAYAGNVEHVLQHWYAVFMLCLCWCYAMLMLGTSYTSWNAGMLCYAMLVLETPYTSYNTGMLCYAMHMLETLYTSYNTGMLCLCYAYAGNVWHNLKWLYAKLWYAYVGNVKVEVPQEFPYDCYPFQILDNVRSSVQFELRNPSVQFSHFAFKDNILSSPQFKLRLLSVHMAVYVIPFTFPFSFTLQIQAFTNQVCTHQGLYQPKLLPTNVYTSKGHSLQGFTSKGSTSKVITFWVVGFLYIRYPETSELYNFLYLCSQGEQQGLQESLYFRSPEQQNP